MKIFILVNILIISITIFITYYFHNFFLERNNSPKISFMEFINNGKMPSMKKLLIGLIFGVTFGFIDNIGLWYGMNNLEKYMPGGILTKSALGNTYSNFMGAIIGTCISIIAADSINYDGSSEPIWMNSLGVVLGCLLGLFVGRTLSNKK